jgi:hypothetical protein
MAAFLSGISGPCHAVLVADRIPVLVDPWLGQVSRHGDGELIGFIEVDSAVRVPRQNGRRDVEFMLQVPPSAEGPALGAHVGQCAARFRQALAGLHSIKRYAVDHAPAGWAAQCAHEPRALTDVLFLDGLEADLHGRVSLVFDFGDLDQLVVRLDEQGQGTAVYLRP